MSESVIQEEPDQISNFVIPILLSRTALERTLNERVDGTIFNDKITEGNLQIAVEKVDSIKIAVKDTTIQYRIPLHILIKKELLLTNLEAEGDIALDFQTNYALNPDWTITTRTQLAGYKWIKEPKAKVLGFKVPVTVIAEQILNFSAKKVTNAIDQQVNDSMVLNKIATQAWQFLQQPILISEPYDTRFKFTPKDFSISPFKTKKDTITSTFFIQGLTQFGLGEHTGFVEDTTLLPLKIQDTNPNNELNLNLTSTIPFEEVEHIARKNFRGESYELGGWKLRIEDIKLEIQKNELTIKVQTSGDYRGWLTLIGRLHFNAQKNQLEIQDVTFNLDTKNLLLKSDKWLFNGLLTNKLAGSMVYPLNESLFFIKKQLQAQLDTYKIQEGIILKGKVNQIAIKNAYIGETALILEVQLNGTVKILIDSIPE